MRTVKKMASAVSIAAFLLCCFFVSSTGSQDDCVYVATGSSFTVPLQHKLKELDKLRWLKDKTVIFYRGNKQVITGKNDDVDSNGSLKLTKLTKDKSGRYTPEVTSAEGINVGDLPSVHLCVLDPVQKPTVTMTCTTDKAKVTFTCNVGKSENNFQIKWFMDDKPEKETGKELTRPVKDVLNARFFCNVSNPVSSETSEPIQQICKSSFPDTLFGISIWVFVGGGAGIVLVLILIVIICCIQTKRKRRLRLKDERELRLHWANQEQQHHHHQHHHHHHQHPNQNNSDQHQHHHPHHHQQQPAGNTGPRQNRTKQPRTQQRPRAPEPANGQPQPNPRRATQASAPAGNGGEEQPPPLPQPRKKTPKAPKE